MAKLIHSELSLDDEGDVSIDYAIGDMMLSLCISSIGTLVYAWRTPGSVEPTGHGTVMLHPAAHEILSRVLADADGARPVGETKG